MNPDGVSINDTKLVFYTGAMYNGRVQAAVKTGKV